MISESMGATHQGLKRRNDLIQARVNKAHLCKFEVNTRG